MWCIWIGMADKVDRFALYRIKYIDEAEATYYQQLGKVLADIEKEIIETVDTLPTILDSATKEQKLFQLKTSVAMRPKIQAIIEKHYPRYADRIVREGFNKQAKRIERAFKALGAVPVAFQSLTETDLALIKNLKLNTFNQFQDIKNRFTRKLNEQLYASTIVGRSKQEAIEELATSINGIYKRSSQQGINRLVGFIEANKFNKRKKEQVKKALARLQTHYGSDRTGESMRRHSTQLINDSFRDFDAQLNAKKSEDAGLTYAKYTGDIIGTTRDHCRKLIKGKFRSYIKDTERKQQGIFSKDEIRKIWTSRNWGGKRGGDAFVVRGGYNCRHQWSYVDPSWYDKSGDLNI